MKVIILGNTKNEIWLDDEDHARWSNLCWSERPDGYAQNHKFGLLHTCLMPLSNNSLVVDHIDQNKLNNQRHNLRYVSRSVNAINHKNQNKPTKHISITPVGRYAVAFMRNYKMHYVGTYNTLTEAQAARDKALQLHLSNATFN